MNATTARRNAIAAQRARKALYVIRYYPANPGVEWRLYTADMKTLLAGAWLNTASAARRDAENALRLWIENPERFAHEKAAACAIRQRLKS